MGEFTASAREFVMVAEYLTKGGIPNGWSVQNLVWLAQAHRRLTGHPAKTSTDIARALWHQRWATLLTDILDTRYGENH